MHSGKRLVIAPRSPNRPSRLPAHRTSSTATENFRCPPHRCEPRRDITALHLTKQRDRVRYRIKTRRRWSQRSATDLARPRHHGRRPARPVTGEQSAEKRPCGRHRAAPVRHYRGMAGEVHRRLFHRTKTDVTLITALVMERDAAENLAESVA
jgi:hypothetical protein